MDVKSTPWQLRGTKYRDWDDLRDDLDYVFPEWETEGGYRGLVEAAVDMELIPDPKETKLNQKYEREGFGELDFSESAMWTRAFNEEDYE